MLELEGELTPILVSLVHREKQTIHMLDPSGNNEIKQELEECKRHLHQVRRLQSVLHGGGRGPCHTGHAFWPRDYGRDTQAA
jgi:hypothetical protein